jgi:hypothetical protein
MVVVVFTIIIPVFLWGIWDSQRPILLPVLIFVAVAYLLYFWRRKAIVSKFERQKARRQASEQRIRLAIENWLELFYCARDDIVFYPDSSEQIPAGEMIAHLLRD